MEREFLFIDEETCGVVLSVVFSAPSYFVSLGYRGSQSLFPARTSSKLEYCRPWKAR